MHPLVERIQELFLPDLERFASQMRERFPSNKFGNSQPEPQQTTLTMTSAWSVSFLYQPKLIRTT
jgi:hypothetical protein